METLNLEKKGKINNSLTGNEHDKYYEFFVEAQLWRQFLFTSSHQSNEFVYCYHFKCIFPGSTHLSLTNDVDF